MREVDLAVVGAGPAGLSAAIQASRLGLEVILIDENSWPGGQLFKQIHKFFGSAEHDAGLRGVEIGKKLLGEAVDSGVKVLLDTVVWGLFEGRELALARGERSWQLKARAIILATGATENTIAFPGWTLPGVMGAGAAQTLMNLHRVLPGRRGMMVGTGNVGLIVAYQILQAGANLSCIIDAAPQISGYGVHAGKLARAGVPIKLSTTIKSAAGNEKVELATTVKVDAGWKPVRGTEEEHPVDFICVAVGLSPLAELAWLAGCRFKYVKELGGHVPIYDENMETTAKGIYVAGDMAGIEEAHTAMEEGRLAAVSAAQALGRIGEQEAASLKGEIRQRIYNLRHGPFGEAARLGLEKLWEKEDRIVP